MQRWLRKSGFGREPSSSTASTRTRANPNTSTRRRGSPERPTEPLGQLLAKHTKSVASRHTARACRDKMQRSCSACPWIRTSGGWS
jgi:hypothetical protein